MSFRQAVSASRQLSNTTPPKLPRSRTALLLGDVMLLDDSGAGLVIVFPYGQDLGGTVDTAASVEDPLEKCRRIFHRRSNYRSSHTMDSGFECFSDGKPVSMLVYQNAVRRKMLDVLRTCGLKLSTFESVDGDEVFMKVCMPHFGEAICHWAQHFQYRMPFRPCAYSDMPPEGDYRGFTPMQNSLERQVPAYHEFEFGIRDSLEPFRKVDEIRLLEKCLDQWMSLPELIEQNVISCYFAAAKYDNVRKLHDEWGSLWNVWKVPSNGYDDEIRDYFGEAVAFFFAWFAFYIQKMLLPLGLLGLLCASTSFQLDHTNRTCLRIVFTIVMSCWASLFNKLFKNRASRLCQAWGMKDYDVVSLERPAYRFELEGTWGLWFRAQFARGCAVFFCLLFIGAVAKVTNYNRLRLQEGDVWHRWYGAYATVGVMKAASIAWSRIAPRLVDIQNHRTQARWNDAITWNLSAVKLFVALFPCIQLAFLQKYTHPTCPDSNAPGHEDVAWKVYGSSGNWPTGIVPPNYTLVNGAMAAAGGADLAWLRPYLFENHIGQTCVFGCYPVECFRKSTMDTHLFGSVLDKLAGEGGVYCCTNCAKSLQENLAVTYMVHALTTVLFLVIPIGLAKLDVWNELRRAKAQGDGRQYSFLQLQAKCRKHAPYEYYSWGGSAVEDFLELAISFALLTCFGIVLPVMGFFALLSHVVEYRLLAYRMTHVTCRPLPFGAQGIGRWQQVFELISFAAIMINVGLAVFFQYPMRDWAPMYQFIAFFVLERLMYILRSALTCMIRDEPEDVTRIEDFNTAFKMKFKMKFEKYTHMNLPADELYSTEDVSIGLRPSPAADCSPNSNWIEVDTASPLNLL